MNRLGDLFIWPREDQTFAGKNFINLYYNSGVFYKCITSTAFKEDNFGIHGHRKLENMGIRFL